MADFVTLTCPSCGGKLQITSDIDRFACAHCGAEHVVKRAGGIVSLAPIVEVLKDVRTGVDKTASELALPRLQAELAALEQERSTISPEFPAASWGIGILWLFVSAIAASVAYLVLGGESTTAYCALCIGGPALFLLGVWIIARLGRDARSSAKREAEEQKARLDEAIRLKQEEIDKHREILRL